MAAVDAKAFAVGALFTAVAGIAGTALFTIALVVGVVGAPLVAGIVAWAVLHRARTRRPGASRSLRLVRTSA